MTCVCTNTILRPSINGISAPPQDLVVPPTPLNVKSCGGVHASTLTRPFEASHTKSSRARNVLAPIKLWEQPVSTRHSPGGTAAYTPLSADMAVTAYAPPPILCLGGTEPWTHFSQILFLPINLQQDSQMISWHVLHKKCFSSPVRLTPHLLHFCHASQPQNLL